MSLMYEVCVTVVIVISITGEEVMLTLVAIGEGHSAVKKHVL